MHFCPDSKETLQDKVLRMVKNDLQFMPLRAKIELPQTGRVLEGGSSL
ncbi:MAG: transposon-encoded TnpW family protein [Oscillospiraceae bacterium]|nr:transposon-encoded TnpW family protein [Oscillospiraceae bacterium]MCL2279509.1 transposon-encoded TnpW family protein [Oscillospiraceae bacterium]